MKRVEMVKEREIDREIERKRVKERIDAAGDDESGWSQRRNCGKLKRGQIEINSRVTKPQLKY